MGRVTFIITYHITLIICSSIMVTVTDALSFSCTDSVPAPATYLVELDKFTASSARSIHNTLKCHPHHPTTQLWSSIHLFTPSWRSSRFSLLPAHHPLHGQEVERPVQQRLWLEGTLLDWGRKVTSHHMHELNFICVAWLELHHVRDGDDLEGTCLHICNYSYVFCYLIIKNQLK